MCHISARVFMAQERHEKALADGSINSPHCVHRQTLPQAVRLTLYIFYSTFRLRVLEGRFHLYLTFTIIAHEPLEGLLCSARTSLEVLVCGGVSVCVHYVNECVCVISVYVTCEYVV